LVATKDIPAGAFVGQTDVQWRNWPADAAFEGLMVKGKVTSSDYVGAVAREGLRKGEPVMRSRLTMPNEGGFLSAVLSPGMRAMTIKISGTSGVAGLIFPNDRVDVILTQMISSSSNESGGGERRISETVLENVRVLALDQKTNDQKKEPKVASLATLEVTPKQAEKVALISRMGTLSLALRSVANEIPMGVNPAPATVTTEVTEDGVSVMATEVVGEEVPMMPGRGGYTLDSEVTRAHRVQIIRGSTATEVIVPGGSN
jgi:pilus assembly protein CpaB